MLWTAAMLAVTLKEQSFPAGRLSVKSTLIGH
jgi:hypothetical protein